MSAPVLTSKAYCLDKTCGWACEGDTATVTREESRHRKVFKHGTSMWTHNPEAPARTPKEAS